MYLQYLNLINLMEVLQEIFIEQKVNIKNYIDTFGIHLKNLKKKIIITVFRKKE